MIPTVRGVMMYDYIIDALKKLEKAEQHFRKKGLDNTPTVSIGMCSEVFQYFFEPYIAELGFDIIAHFGEYPQMIKELNEGILDLVITPKKLILLLLYILHFLKKKSSSLQVQKQILQIWNYLSKIKNGKNSKNSLPIRLGIAHITLWSIQKLFGLIILIKSKYLNPTILFPISFLSYDV